MNSNMYKLGQKLNYMTNGEKNHEMLNNQMNLTNKSQHREAMPYSQYMTCLRQQLDNDKVRTLGKRSGESQNIANLYK